MFCFVLFVPGFVLLPVDDKLGLNSSFILAITTFSWRLFTLVYDKVCVPIQVFIVDYSFRLSIDLRTDDYCFNLIIITLTTLSKSAISRIEYFHFKWFYQNYYCSAFAIWTIFYPEFVMIISTYKSPLSKFVCFLIAFGSVSS